MIIFNNMKLKQFFKHLYVKTITMENPSSSYIVKSLMPQANVNIGDLDEAQNEHEKLIGKLYNYSIENPNLYKDVTIIYDYKEIIINNKARIRLCDHNPRDKFSYDWKIEWERLDTQALFPELVEGILANITYSFDVRHEYSIFIKEFFNKRSYDILDELL